MTNKHVDANGKGKICVNISAVTAKPLLQSPKGPNVDAPTTQNKFRWHTQ